VDCQLRDGRTDSNIFTSVSPNGRVIGSSIVHNLTYRLEMESELTFLATIENIGDKDPEFARLELNYDPLTAQNPLGRTIKVGVRKKF
jgi:iron complex outermembrane recepter protein